jgi:hypothetical protein
MLTVIIIAVFNIIIITSQSQTCLTHGHDIFYVLCNKYLSISFSLDVAIVIKQPE